MDKTPTSNAGCLRGLLLIGLVGVCLGWAANQVMVWAVGNQSDQWVPAELSEFLPRRIDDKSAAPVEFGPGIIEEQSVAAGEASEGEEATGAPAEPPGTGGGGAKPEEPTSPRAAVSESKEIGDKTNKEKDHPKPASDAQKAPESAASQPAPPTRVFTADREALRTQFKKPSDLYAHGHYLPNEQEDGVQRGLRFAHVAPGGVFARMGFQRGDVVLSVNGVALNNQNDVLANFENMRKMNILNMRLERDGEPLTHRYILK